ncbi:CAP domain-containing protein [Leucobacter soli]
MRTQILDRTNALRKAAGVPALKMNTDINTVAQTWSRAQASKKKMSHNPSYSKQIPSGWRTAGENVAYGYASAKAVVTAWKNSDGHYANMVRSTFTHVGIGIALDSKGRLYYTQTFAGYSGGKSGDFAGGSSRTALDPTLSGSARAGKTLTAKPGKWKPGTVTYRYQWMRNFKTKISGATKATYKPTAKDAGKRISVRVTGRFEDGTTAVRASDTRKVPLIAYAKAPRPKVSGTAKVGRTLTAKASGWSPKPSKIRYQWYRNGKAISGATKTKYRLKSADAGKKITVRVAPTRTGYAKTTRSTTVKVKS